VWRYAIIVPAILVTYLLGSNLSILGMPTKNPWIIQLFYFVALIGSKDITKEPKNSKIILVGKVIQKTGSVENFTNVQRPGIDSCS
jgi:hypothetical protein